MRHRPRTGKERATACTARRGGAAVPAPVALGVAYLVGSIPVTNIASRLVAGVDLRDVGTGTVSGTSLYRVSSFRTLAVAGCLELAKGAIGPALAGRSRPLLGAASASVAIAGHNWSPWLGLRGGRGVSLTLGAGLVVAPEATALLGVGLGIGRLVRQTGAATLLALLALVPVLGATRGRLGVATACLLGGPVLLKRLLGNDNRIPADVRVAVTRLVTDAEQGGRLP